MVRKLNGAIDIFLASGNIREDRCKEIVRAHSQDLRRNLPTVSEAKQSERATSVPSPTIRENGRCNGCLFQNSLYRFDAEKAKNILQRKAVLFGQGDVQPVLSSCRLQFEVERRAKAFPERQSPRFVDASAEWCVDDK